MRRGAAVALLAGGCALAAVAAATGPYLSKTRPPADLRIQQLLRGAAVERQRRLVAPPREAGLWEVVLEVVFLVALGLAALYGVWRLGRLLHRLVALWLQRSPGGVRTAEHDAGEESRDDAETALRRRVADELTALSADLDEPAEPREAVIACYVRMERAFADAGAARSPTESPMELLARVLADLRVPADDVRRLTALFGEARFSRHPVTDEMRDAARRSLRNVAAALAVRA